MECHAIAPTGESYHVQKVKDVGEDRHCTLLRAYKGLANSGFLECSAAFNTSNVLLYSGLEEYLVRAIQSSDVTVELRAVAHQDKKFGLFTANEAGY